MRNKPPQIDYAEVAKILECSPRNARRLINRSNVRKIRKSYHDVRFERAEIVALKDALNEKRQLKIVIHVGGAR